ncbi:MAG: hypothetical protein KF691_02380 [Phycisphaeraceae bacterium]|nr:hypothetical protein [Phycisphaeraceae bacterium]
MPEANPAEPAAAGDLPVRVLCWEGAAPGLRRGAIGVMLENGEFRTAKHVLEIHPGSGFFLKSYKSGFLDGTPVEWDTVHGGDYSKFRAGSQGDDWAQLRLAPHPAIRGLPFDGLGDLPPGTRVAVVGFDRVVSAITPQMTFDVPQMVVPATVVATPSRRFRDSDDTTGLAYLRPDAKGIRPGWSGAPVIAFDLDGNPRVVGTLISVYSEQGTAADPEAPNLDAIQYATFVRSGPPATKPVE